MYKKVVFVCLFEFFLTFSLPSRRCETRGSDNRETNNTINPSVVRGSYILLRFDVGVTWTRMLDGKANGSSQYFLYLRSVASGLEKPLLAG